jgi:hypothetical protein
MNVTIDTFFKILKFPGQFLFVFDLLISVSFSLIIMVSFLDLLIIMSIFLLLILVSASIP